MSAVTENVAKFVREKGINLTKLSKGTNIEYCAIYDSLGNSGRGRDLKDEEFVRICRFIGKNPMDFAESNELFKRE